MRGMNAHDGRAIEGLPHLRQSIEDILTTPIGSRVMRRDYGSRLPRLVDTPVNDALLIDLYIATAEALDRWEPRLEVRSVAVTEARVGSVTLSVEGVYRPDGQDIKIEGLIV